MMILNIKYNTFCIRPRYGWRVLSIMWNRYFGQSLPREVVLVQPEAAAHPLLLLAAAAAANVAKSVPSSAKGRCEI